MKTSWYDGNRRNIGNPFFGEGGRPLSPDIHGAQEISPTGLTDPLMIIMSRSEVWLIMWKSTGWESHGDGLAVTGLTGKMVLKFRSLSEVFLRCLYNPLVAAANFLKSPPRHYLLQLHFQSLSGWKMYDKSYKNTVCVSKYLYHSLLYIHIFHNLGLLK